MKERVSILMRVIPKYGEILLGVGSVVLENSESFLENITARNEVKTYLLKNAPKRKNLAGVCNSLEFQNIIHKYTSKFICVKVLENGKNSNDDSKVNIFLLDFFYKVIWPIIIEKYMDNIYGDVDSVMISINVKKNAYLNIYGEDNPSLFFSEFKEFLLCNYIVISGAITQENGDMLLKLVIPIPPHGQFEF